MLDNRNSGLDPSFIDQAWEDMRRQLDEAMPVESKKRRPALVWWWAAALLLPIIIGVGLYPGAETPKLQALPIPGHGKVLAGPQSPQKVAPQEAETDSENSSPSASNTFIENPVISKQTFAPISPVTAQIANEQVAKSSVALEPQSPLSQDTVLEPKQAKTNAIPPGTVAPRRNLVGNRQVLPLLEAIPTGTPLELPINELAFEKEPNVSTGNSRYMLEVGTSTRSFLTLDGYFVGVSKEWQKKSSRWSFGMGVHYRHQMIPFQTSDLLKVNTTRAGADQMDSPLQEEALKGAFAAVDFASGVARFIAGDSSINVPLNSLNLIQRLHYIDLPTYANFRLGRKWEAFASVRFSYLAKAYLDHTNRPVSRATEDFAFNNVGSGSQTGNYASQLVSNTRLGTNTSDFQRFMLSGAMGLTYYPSSRIGWRLQYSSTPVSLYKLGSINTRDHWLGTSIIWRFGAK